MSCSLSETHKPDWNAYALGELTAPACREAEVHLAACAACRDELATLRLTLDTLSTLRQEEPPRRIAFVSDKVFEPRWWRTLWNPTFASACVLAVAILVHASTRPEGVTREQIDETVTRAVAHLEDRLVDLDRTDQQLARAYVVTAGMVRQ